MAAALSETQKRLLECPVCLERLKPPVDNCVNGHGICGECRKNLSACAICRQEFAKERNTLLNQVIESMAINCKYSTEGCNHVSSLKDIGNHESSCNYKPATEMCFSCDKTFSILELNDHFNEHGGLKIEVNLCETFFLEIPMGIDSLSQIVYVKNIKTHFSVRCLIDWQDQVILFCIQYIGKKEEANNYTYHISINQGSLLSNTPYYFSCNGICVPYFYMTEEIISKPKIIKLDLNSIFFESNHLVSGFIVEVDINRSLEPPINELVRSLRLSSSP